MTYRLVVAIFALLALGACMAPEGPENDPRLCAKDEQKKDGGIGGTGNAPEDCPE